MLCELFQTHLLHTKDLFRRIQDNLLAHMETGLEKHTISTYKYTQKHPSTHQFF
jgi:hypothetical protein